MDGQNLLYQDGTPLSDRTELLLERPGRNCPCGPTATPTFASIVAKNNYQYTEYYHGDHNTNWWDPSEYPPTIDFQEFYNLAPGPGQDLFEQNNQYGADGKPSNHPPTNPPADVLKQHLAVDRVCGGYSPTRCP
jgi:hypothetical protein